MPTSTRPFRFAAGAGRVSTKQALVEAARRLEDLGYSTFCVADHMSIPFAPLLSLQAVADATATIRVGQLVLAQGFRHPAVLAKELATLDVLTDGRVEIGIGAGWMESEFAQTGLPFAGAGERIAQLEEYVTILKGLFAAEPFDFSGDHYRIAGLTGSPEPVQRPHPPLMIGGGGRKLLSLAGRHADIIQVLPGPNRGGAGRPDISPGAFEERLEWIRSAAGERFDQIELSTLLLQVTVTDDSATAEEEFLSRFASPSDRSRDRHAFLASPAVAIGSLDRVCEKLLETRERFGFSYLTAPVGGRPEDLAAVIERLTGA